MDTSTIQSIDVLFAQGKDQCTRLSIIREAGLVYSVRGVCSRSFTDNFPIQELVERHAKVSDTALQELFAAFDAAELDTWYHHYGCFTDRYLFGYTGLHALRWSLRVTFDDETTCHWEGEDDSPASLGTIYDACSEAGMPALRMGYYGSFADRCKISGSDYDLALSRMEHYHDLLTDALQNRSALVNERTEDDYRTLVQEFDEDLTRFVASYQVSPLSSRLPDGWNATTSAGELCARKTDHADKAQVFALLSSLLSCGEPGEATRIAIRSKAYQRWLRRLREIPKEEARERARQEKLEREEQRRQLDVSIEEHIKKGTTFTAADVANEIGAKTSMANGRLRRYVTRGELAIVGDTSPRVYCAA